MGNNIYKWGIFQHAMFDDQGIPHFAKFYLNPNFKAKKSRSLEKKHDKHKPAAGLSDLTTCENAQCWALIHPHIPSTRGESMWSPIFDGEIL